jgi:hypothetical protein
MPKKAEAVVAQLNKTSKMDARLLPVSVAARLLCEVGRNAAALCWQTEMS